MKSKNDVTVIGSSEVTITGDVYCDDNVTIRCIVKGNVTGTANITLNGSAMVTGNITAESLTIVDGTVKGNIKVDGRTALHNAARVEGDIVTGTISIEGGAVFNGKCQTSGAAKEQ